MAFIYSFINLFLNEIQREHKDGYKNRLGSI